MPSIKLDRPAASNNWEPAHTVEAVAKKRCAYLSTWIKTNLSWYWIRSDACLVGLLAFSVTSITQKMAARAYATGRS